MKEYAAFLRAAKARNRTMYRLRRSGMTLDAIGRRYGISRERVRQIVDRFAAQQ